MDKGRPSQDQIDIAKTLAGDMDAFAILVNRYKYMVYTLAVRMLRNREDAEEVAQDTFVKAYHGLVNFSGSSKFSTWLYKIAYNKSLDYLRRNRRQPEMTSDFPEDRRLQIHKPEIVEKMDIDDRKNTLDRALKNLAEDDSLIITLYYLEEMTLDEIATVVGMSPNTAKVRLHRARKKLAVLLTNFKAQYIPGEYGYK
jgi:RNA polymerase sigma-70 factor (ECF subfamily)